MKIFSSQVFTKTGEVVVGNGKHCFTQKTAKEMPNNVKIFH